MRDFPIKNTLVSIIFVSVLSACGGGTDSDPGSNPAPDTNSVPAVSGVTILDNNGGRVILGDVLTGNYSYSDVDSDAEGASTYRWYRNNTQIPGAVSDTYTIVNEDVGNTILFEVIPVALTGSKTGAPVKSSGINVVVPNNDASLAGLSIQNIQLDQTFQANLHDYTATAGFLARKINLHATVNDVNASISVNGVNVENGSFGYADLAVGDNSITVVITAEDNTNTQTYNLTVTRDTLATLAHRSYIKASNAGSNDFFGGSIALEGDTLVVGATGEDGDVNSTANNPNDNAISTGAVYVFRRNGASWIQEAYIKASDSTSDCGFGYSIALSGDILAIGAYRENVGSALDAGAVYIYKRSGSNWDFQTRLTHENYKSYDEFGTRIALSDNTLVVGVPNVGAVFVYTQNNNEWSQEAYLQASNAHLSDDFGYAISFSGNKLAVGAPLEDGDVNSTVATPNDKSTDSGAVYIFSRNSSVWSQEAYIKAVNTGSHDHFGDSVSIHDNVLAVGAPEEEGDANSTKFSYNNHATGAGAVYVFTQDNSSWTQKAYLKASNVDNFDFFGSGVAISGDTVIVAAYEDGDNNSTAAVPNNNANGAGAVYIFSHNGPVWQQDAYIKASNAGAEDSFGSSGLFIAGGELVISALGEAGDATSTISNSNDNAANAGAVYIYQ